jgi:hypothetical protein
VHDHRIGVDAGSTGEKSGGSKDQSEHPGLVAAVEPAVGRGQGPVVAQHKGATYGLLPACQSDY